MDHLALYSVNCKRCKHLDPEEEKQYDQCHFSNGNKQCPASSVQLAVVGEALRFAESIKKARASGNINREVKILQAVGRRSPAFQHKFQEWSSK